MSPRERAGRDILFLKGLADYYDGDPKDCRLGPFKGRTFHLSDGRVVEYLIEGCRYRIDGGEWQTDDMFEEWRVR